MLKTIYDPARDHFFKLGRRAPRVPHPKLKASRVLDLGKIAVPTTTNFRAKANTSLRRLFKNDELGDCVCAWIAHYLGLVTGAAGAEYICTDDQVLKLYEAIGGYVPGDSSTDNGCDEDTAINYIETVGFPNGTKLLGAIAVDATNPAEIHACNFVFEGLTFAVGLADQWISPFPAGDGFVWDKAPPNPQNGHSYGALDNDPRGVVVGTWGLEGIETFDAIAETAGPGTGGQLLALLTPDQLARGMTKAPNGVDWATIISFFNARGGNIPVPTPAPNPAPSPAPAKGPTLAQAKAAIRDAIQRRRGPQAISRTDAIKACGEALAALPGWPT
jgi:hypothetical protein